MKTKGYATLSATSQILSILIISVNACGLVISLIYYYLISIERIATADFTVTYYTFGIYTLCLNIVVALFSNCIVTLGNKALMRIYSRLMIATWLATGILTVYLYFFYMIFLRSALSQQISTPSTYTMVLPAGMQRFKKTDAFTIIKDEFTYIIRVFGWLQLVSLSAMMGLLVCVRWMVAIKLYVVKEKAPPMIELSRRGLDTGALKDRNVVEVAVR